MYVCMSCRSSRLSRIIQQQGWCTPWLPTWSRWAGRGGGRSWGGWFCCVGRPAYSRRFRQAHRRCCQAPRRCPTYWSRRQGLQWTRSPLRRTCWGRSRTSRRWRGFGPAAGRRPATGSARCSQPRARRPLWRG